MRTSNTQFEILVNYMEQHGDIINPGKTPAVRILNIKKWEDLSNLLNSDPTGQSKATEKWKKVWSDLKNNTKKKAARINKAASGTSGGPALKAKLTELEERVLVIMKPQAATGCTDVAEAGCSKEQLEDTDSTTTLSSTPPSIPGSPNTKNADSPTQDQEIWNMPGPSLQQDNPSCSSPVLSQVDNVSVIHPKQEVCVTPVQVQERPSSRAGQTPQCRRGFSMPQITGSSRRPRRVQSHMDRASGYFLKSDEEWKGFLMKKHEDDCRIREMEIQTQQKWQDVTMLALHTINKVIDKCCKD